MPASPPSDTIAKIAEAERDWQPIETAPIMHTVLLWAWVDTETGNWRMATGYWSFGHEAWKWEGQVLKADEAQPTHWQHLPDPPEDTP